jgi:predicted dehydrogenase
MKIAIIGLGPHGKRLLTAAREYTENTKIAIVDLNQKVLDSIDDVLKFSDYKQMLNTFKPEIVIVATNGPSHFSLAKMAILDGVKKVLITKPLTCTLHDAYELEKLAIDNQVKVAVDHGLRFDKTYNWIKNQASSNIWGELLSVHIMRNGIGLGCLGTHSFDLANFLFDAKPSFVSCWVDTSFSKNPRGEQFVDPGGLVILNYSNDKKAIISQIEKGSGPMVVQVFYERARLTIDVKFGTLQVVTISSDGNKTVGREINPHNENVDHNTIELMIDILGNLISEDELQANIKHGLDSVEILVAAYMSSENGHIPIGLPISDETYLNKFLPVT